MLTIPAVADVWSTNLATPDIRVVETPPRPSGALEAYPTRINTPHNSYTEMYYKATYPREHRKSVKFFARAACAAPRRLPFLIADVALYLLHLSMPRRTSPRIKMYVCLFKAKNNSEALETCLQN